MIRSVWSAAFVAALIAAPHALAQQVLDVPLVSNLFAASHSTPESPAGGGSGELPPHILLPRGVDRELLIQPVTGLVRYCPTCDPNGPDGVPISPACAISGWRGLSGYQAERSRGLMGVFLDDAEASNPAPAAILWSESAVQQPIVAAALRQLLFIGDGLTGTGTGSAQEFVVPSDATRLYLGFVDGLCGSSHGFFGDNSGGVSATIAYAGCMWLLEEPQSATVCPSGTVVSSISVAGTGPFTYRWQWEDRRTPDVWTDLDEGPNTDTNGEVRFSAMGTIASEVHVFRDTHPQGDLAVIHAIRVVVSSACTSMESIPAHIDVCIGDTDCDGDTDSDDITTFFGAWDSGDEGGDTDGDGDTDSDDIIAFFTAWDSGC